MADALLTRASLLIRLRDPDDRVAWQQFVDLYGGLVYAFARKRGLQDADAADLTQEVFQAVAKMAGRWEYNPARGTFRTGYMPLPATRLPSSFAAASPTRLAAATRIFRNVWPRSQVRTKTPTLSGTGVPATAFPPGRRADSGQLRGDDLASLLANRRRGPAGGRSGGGPADVGRGRSTLPRAGCWPGWRNKFNNCKRSSPTPQGTSHGDGFSLPIGRPPPSALDWRPCRRGAGCRSAGVRVAS